MGDKGKKDKEKSRKLKQKQQGTSCKNCSWETTRKSPLKEIQPHD